MSVIESMPVTEAGPSIPLRFEMTSDEAFRFTLQLCRSRRRVWSVWLNRIAAAGTAYIAIYSAVDGAWLTAVLMAYVAISVGSQHMAMLWLMRMLFGGITTRAELELDSTGMHGELAYLSTRRWGNEHKRVNYAWNRLRKVERLPEYLVLEFHGGSQVLIPVRAFASSSDLDQCAKWVEGGLAQQRRKSA